MSNTPQPLPVNLQQSPDVPLPPAVQAMLQNAQQGASQPPQSSITNIPPITSTPEYQAVQQAGQGSLGVPGYNDQGQPTPAVGVKDRLKRALSDAIFAIGEGFQKGPGAAIESATPQGREYVHQQRQLEAEQAKAQQMQELGMAQGRLYQGMGRIGEAQAAQTRAGYYGQYVQALAPKFTAQIQYLGSRTALTNLQADLLPKEFALKQFTQQVNAAYKTGMLGVEKNRTQILQQATNIKQALLPYQQTLFASMAQLQQMGQFDKVSELSRSFAEASDMINKFNTFENQIMHPEQINSALQLLGQIQDSYGKLAPGAAQKVEKNLGLNQPVAPQAPPSGMIIMRGPKGTFHVPAGQVPVFKKNGYSVVGKQ